MTYGNPEFPDQGPREWTPRWKKALREVEWLRALIPPDLIQEIKKPEYIYDSLTGYRAKLILLVRARKWTPPWKGKGWEWLPDRVWMNRNGEVIVEAGIRDLLAGKVKGFEHLVGLWDGTWPPPKPVLEAAGSRK